MRRAPDRRRRRRALGAFCGAALALACSTDTSGLARRSPAGGGEGGASSGFAPSAGSGGERPASGGSGGGAPVDSGEAASVQLVHGVLDGGDLYVCLRQVGGAALGGDAPQPEAGVAYGQSFRLPVFWDAALDVEALLFVAAGGLAGRTCGELIELTQARLPAADAGATGSDAGLAEVFPLDPVSPRSAGSVRFPPGLLRGGTHYALVAAGCTGRGGSPEVCGEPDAIFGSSQALALAEISGEIVGQGGGGFGLQFLNASRALSRAGVVLQGETEQESRRLAEDVGFGAVRPRDSAPADEPVGVELRVEGALDSSYTAVWANLLAAAGGAPIVSGGHYLLVYVGPVPGFGAGLMAGPRFVLVHGG